jgi:hypothetical protein
LRSEQKKLQDVCFKEFDEQMDKVADVINNSPRCKYNDSIHRVNVDPRDYSYRLHQERFNKFNVTHLQKPPSAQCSGCDEENERCTIELVEQCLLLTYCSKCGDIVYTDTTDGRHCATCCVQWPVTK